MVVRKLLSLKKQCFLILNHVLVLEKIKLKIMLSTKGNTKKALFLYIQEEELNR